MIKITSTISLNDDELEFNFIRSSGPGGQNVNKVASAVQLRFNILHSPTLPDEVRLRLLLLVGSRLTSLGDVIIKASRYRTQERNKQDVLQRLQDLIRRAAEPPKKRHKTRPTQASKQRRLVNKKRHGQIKHKRSTKRSQWSDD
jgi:ribosome-associated protein